MNIDEVIQKRRTIHSFNNDIVADKFILNAIKSANYAPCHKLTFPWRFSVISSGKRNLLLEYILQTKFSKGSITKEVKEKLIVKYMNPSHLIIPSQIKSKDEIRKKEDFAACVCSIQNFILSLAQHNIHCKWSTNKLIYQDNFYRILDINSSQEEILGLLWVGYGKEPAAIKRPEISSILRHK